MNQARRSTINDVARLAGVSITTVSRFLNHNYTKMSEATRQKIDEAVKHSDYHVNRQAQTLKKQSSRLIGVVVADVENFFSSLLFKGADEVLAKKNFQIILMNSNNSQIIERRQIQRLLELQIDGILLQPMSSKSSNYSYLQKQRIPLVIVDRQIQPTLWPEVVTDNYAYSKKLGQLMIQMQYPQILVVSEPIDKNSARQERYMALFDLQKQNSFQLGLVEIQKTTNDEEIFQSLRKKTNNFHTKTALYALKGPLLLRIMRILNQRHVSVPDQIGLSAFDDWEWAKLTHPVMTTIQQNPKIIGSTAAQVLVKEIEGTKPIKAETIIVESQLNVGHSL
ncbi:LacI family DNA-binding transcriptional regulator [Oenococcus kitaharae]|uniref:Ribose operon repressor n=1 Tax=Oenococcus kitaharae DSM 17330 TaxID=1045004 RepID=G9WHM2_9LACO|nr:LacI family DNA-binding transcriptional regulator [Oenococcus kitaharae]EHN58361.1 Ribose operon repressor [Oenococcus kitaharae DSM 17330]MCV3296396.1 LacI family DNA-binding transcriptional regulator [Oenococcus kitaharae]OEY81474.1 transcriptional regulator [Oenococcus kitaharae]OEY82961.1 transcriptional regulator [Oenococcus kitaharae]OEY84494.1 transcriptional regulator [Oenococcus kitaharae]